VFNNVIHDVDGNAVLVWIHPGGEENGGTVNNVRIINNTAYNTGRLHGGVGGYKAEFDGDGIIISNNITWEHGGYAIKTTPNITVSNNLCADSNKCSITSNPKFVDAANRDLRIRSTSPAINKGTSSKAPDFDYNDNIRPLGGKHDIGAHEKK